jgi:hypothetical protein
MSIRGLDAEGFEALGRAVGKLIKRVGTLDVEIQRRSKEIARSHPIPFGS